jgi:hypothetical protein
MNEVINYLAAWRCQIGNENWPRDEHCFLPAGTCDVCQAHARIVVADIAKLISGPISGPEDMARTLENPETLADYGGR